MRVRETKLSDYGFTRTEVKQLRKFCRQLDSADKKMLLECAMEVKADISKDLYYTITSGNSFDKLESIKYVAINRTDFYAYQKKVLATFKKMLVERGRYPINDR